VNVHEDDSLLDAIERQTVGTLAFIQSATKRLLDYENWLTRHDRTLVESVKDRARLHEDTERETEARKDADERETEARKDADERETEARVDADTRLQGDMDQLRAWLLWIVIGLAALVLIFLIAIVFNPR
jgi:hypothetical protein